MNQPDRPVKNFEKFSKRFRFTLRISPIYVGTNFEKKLKGVQMTKRYNTPHRTRTIK